MHTEYKAAVIIASLLTTVLEVEHLGPTPLSPLYLGLQERVGMTMLQWEVVLGVLRETGLVTTTSETIRLTEAGRRKATELTHVLEAAQRRN